MPTPPSLLGYRHPIRKVYFQAVKGCGEFNCARCSFRPPGAASTRGNLPGKYVFATRESTRAGFTELKQKFNPSEDLFIEYSLDGDSLANPHLDEITDEIEVLHPKSRRQIVWSMGAVPSFQEFLKRMKHVTSLVCSIDSMHDPGMRRFLVNRGELAPRASIDELYGKIAERVNWAFKLRDLLGAQGINFSVKLNVAGESKEKDLVLSRLSKFLDVRKFDGVEFCLDGRRPKGQNLVLSTARDEALVLHDGRVVQRMPQD